MACTECLCSRNKTCWHLFFKLSCAATEQNSVVFSCLMLLLQSSCLSHCPVGHIASLYETISSYWYFSHVSRKAWNYAQLCWLHWFDSQGLECQWHNSCVQVELHTPIVGHFLSRKLLQQYHYSQSIENKSTNSTAYLTKLTLTKCYPSAEIKIVYFYETELKCFSYSLWNCVTVNVYKFNYNIPLIHYITVINEISAWARKNIVWVFSVFLCIFKSFFEIIYKYNSFDGPTDK